LSAWHTSADGVALRVKAQPRARRAGVGGIAPGIDGPSLRVAVTEAPEDGRASEAVRTALAEALAVAPSAVALRQGASSRQKLFHVAGDAEALIARLEALA
jgi:uncharacterized protein YggU (UPF0235/DUF167 family)